jgi:hypothetical protein
MSEEDLELLITLDDPEGAPEEDIFNHLPAEKYLEALARSAAREGNSVALFRAGTSHSK